MAPSVSPFKRFIFRWGKWVGLAGVLFVVFVFGVWISAPGSSYDSSYEYYSSTGSAAPESYEEGMMDDAIYDRDMMTTATPTSMMGEVVEESRIIKTANLTLDVKDTATSLTDIADKVSEFNGYVQTSSTWVESDESVTGYMVVRVDSQYFEAFLEFARSLATVVESESISGQDVTAEYIDLEARLTNLKAEEEQYLSILNEATTVEELLMVSDYLAGVRGEIEQIEGQLKYLSDQTDYSTITIYLYEEPSLVAPTSNWQPLVVVTEAIQTLIVFGQGLVELAIWAVVFGIPALVCLWLLRVIWRKTHRRGKSSR